MDAIQFNRLHHSYPCIGTAGAENWIESRGNCGDFAWSRSPRNVPAAAHAVVGCFAGAFGLLDLGVFNFELQDALRFLLLCLIAHPSE